MDTMIAASLNEVIGAESDLQPANTPTYFAWKGKRHQDKVWFGTEFSGAGPIPGTLTDAAPALTILHADAKRLEQRLYLAWKVAGKKSIGVMYMMNLVPGWPFLPLPGIPGSPALPLEVPGAYTDAAPALIIGPNNHLYLAWKKVPASNLGKTDPHAASSIEWCFYDGNAWSAPAPIPLPSARTRGNPALGLWTSPESVLCLAVGWQDADTDGVFWGYFVPGETLPTPYWYAVPGAFTDKAPALTTGFAVWKGKNQNSMFCAPLYGGADVSVLPQVLTTEGPAAFFETGSNNLYLAWIRRNTNQVWTGAWYVEPEPAEVPMAGLAGNYNYYFVDSTYPDNCLIGVEITIDITTDLVSTNGFSIQLNAYSQSSDPYSNNCSFQQYAFELGEGFFFPNVNIYPADSNNPIIIPAGLEFHPPISITEAILPAGSRLTISIDYHKPLPVNNQMVPGIVKGATLSGLYNSKVPIQIQPYPIVLINYTNAITGGKITTEDEAPITSFQLIIAGFDNGEKAAFTSGAGTITYRAQNNLVAVAGGISAVETSNCLYGVLPAGPGNSVTQRFCVNVPAAGQ